MSEHKLDRRFKNHCEWNNETKGRYISTRVIVFYTRVNYISDCPLTKITGFFYLLSYGQFTRSFTRCTSEDLCKSFQEISRVVELFDYTRNFHQEDSASVG